ncbi:MAG: hypothetical protein D6715_01060 [Calditrichaeota bacterium]|nr:MAG: hypothetical protein D6715_01060 [Calditrichota bacterium]
MSERRSPLRIAIQGERGSTNEQAIEVLARKHNWQDCTILYAVSTDGVFRALHSGEADLGTFAIRTTRGGWVKESLEAIFRFNFCKLDQIEVPIDHVLLYWGRFDPGEKVTVVSHPQAIKVHRSFLIGQFPEVRFQQEADTGLAAKKLKEGRYPKNTLIIAPRSCARLYNLPVLSIHLEKNRGYRAIIWLVGRSPEPGG